MVLSYLTKGPAQTKKIGKNFSSKILKKKNLKHALILGLEGDLGGGKTTFLQGFARGLGIKQKVLSPTFVIMKKFKIDKGPFRNFYHLDCYRLDNPKEILKLGFKKIASDSRNIVAVEWAEKIKKVLPKKTVLIKFRFINSDKRKLTII